MERGTRRQEARLVPAPRLALAWGAEAYLEVMLLSADQTSSW